MPIGNGVVRLHGACFLFLHGTDAEIHTRKRRTKKKTGKNPVFLACAAAITWLALLPVRKLPLRPELLALPVPLFSPCDAWLSCALPA